MTRRPEDERSTSVSLLRSLRIAALLTQEQLAERAHVSVRTIRNIESGRVTLPRGDTVRLLARALDLDDEDRARLVRRCRAEGPGEAAADVGAPGAPEGSPAGPHSRASALRVVGALLQARPYRRLRSLARDLVDEGHRARARRLLPGRAPGGPPRAGPV